MTTRDHIHCTEPPEGDDDMRDDEDVRKGATSVPASWAAERAEAHGGNAEIECARPDLLFNTPFTCPECGSHHFGASMVGTPEVTVSCHGGAETRDLSGEPPQYVKPCRWSGPYDLHVTNWHMGETQPRGVVDDKPPIQEFPAFGDAVSRAMPYVVGGGVNYLCVACRDTGIAGKNICVSCPRCDSDSCLVPGDEELQRTPIRMQFGLHLCNPHTGDRWCNVACLRASGLDDCLNDGIRAQLLAAVFGEFTLRMYERYPHVTSESLEVFHERTVPLLEELTQYAQAALAGLRSEEGS